MRLGRLTQETESSLNLTTASLGHKGVKEPGQILASSLNKQSLGVDCVLGTWIEKCSAGTTKSLDSSTLDP